MLKKTLFSFVVVIQIITNSFYAQQTVDNDKAHRRYWYYRTRMINDFMKIGKNQGDCIVFAERNLNKSSASKSKLAQVGPDQIDLANMYIMTLALEYKLLSRNYQDTRGTVNELYHLLYMINRLDMEADQFWSNPMPTGPNINANTSDLNGFMIREDIPPSYISDNVKHFNYSILESGNPSMSNSTAFAQNYGGFCGTDFTDELTSTKFNSFVTQDINTTDNNPHNDDLFEVRDEMGMPHDKFHSMLTALMFVNKYIPYGVNNGQQFQDGEWDLKSESKKIADRIYNYIKGQNSSWVLTYPDFTIANNHILNVGAQAQIYSWPFSRMACFNHKDFPWSINDFCSSYTDPTAIGIGLQSYKSYSKLPQPSMDAAVFMAWDQVGSNASAFSGIPMPAYISMQANTAAWSIQWAELARKVLHQNGALLKQLSVFGEPINSAPCQGPYNYGNCDHGGWEWSSQDRTEHPNSRGNGCNNSNGVFAANYPGVDYMLLHNLYYEFQNQMIDGNQGNVGFSPFGNVVSVIYNAANNLPGVVNSALCSIGNAIGGIFGNSNLCDPTIPNSGNGGAGSNNSNLVGYYGYNLMDNRDANIWPRQIGPPSFGIPIQGTNSNVSKVAVFQNLSSTAHIYASSSPAAPQNSTPSNVIYRAGKEIILEPGFTVDAGSTFHAYVQRYICSGNNDALNMRKLKDSTLTIDLADYEADIINPIPMHYYESPKSDADNNPLNSDESYPEDYIADLKPLDEIKTSEFDISPNPTSSKTVVHTKKSSENEIFSIHVYDMKGGLIYIYENVSSNFEIDLSSYSKGVYMVRVISSLGNSVTKKISLIE